jgi:hypothetical protein
MLVRLAGTWLAANAVDASIKRAGDPYAAGETTFQVTAGTKMLIDAGIRLLAFCNQMTVRGVRVGLRFEDGTAMGYLDRMGFFDHLAPAVLVEPDRPAVSGATVFGGNNSGLVEICAIRPGLDTHELIYKLNETIRATCGGRPDFPQFEEAMSTILSELVGNVFLHGGEGATGHAAFQSYPSSNKARVVVSDDGRGLMQTIRPALHGRNPAYGDVRDVDLLVEMFRDGLSWFDDPGHGNGLKGCATKAIRYRAKLDVRLRTQAVRLVPSGDAYLPSTAVLSTDLAEIDGTHIAFELSLV